MVSTPSPLDYLPSKMDCVRDVLGAILSVAPTSPVVLRQLRLKCPASRTSQLCMPDGRIAIKHSGRSWFCFRNRESLHAVHFRSKRQLGDRLSKRQSVFSLLVQLAEAAHRPMKLRTAGQWRYPLCEAYEHENCVPGRQSGQAGPTNIRHRPASTRSRSRSAPSVTRSALSIPSSP